MDVPATVTEAVQSLQARGFDDRCRLESQGVRCAGCGHICEAGKLEITDVYRFEGPSDPGDEAIVLGVQCPACGLRGIVVSAFGADADDQLRALVNAVPPDAAS